VCDPRLLLLRRLLLPAKVRALPSSSLGNVGNARTGPAHPLSAAAHVDAVAAAAVAIAAAIAARLLQLRGQLCQLRHRVGRLVALG